MESGHNGPVLARLHDALVATRTRLAEIAAELPGLPGHPGCRQVASGARAYVTTLKTVMADSRTLNLSARYRDFACQYREMAVIVADVCDRPAKAARALETILGGGSLRDGTARQDFHPDAVNNARPLLEEALGLARELAPAGD